MGRWRIEASEDGASWTELAAFFWARYALHLFDFEVEHARHAWLRLVSPDGTVEERTALGRARPG